MKDQAIYHTHPSVVEIINSKDCFDADGNKVVLDDAKVSAELARLQAEWDSQDYARKRKAEYPTIEELVVALYDTDDKTALEKRRADVKKKYPKP